MTATPRTPTGDALARLSSLGPFLLYDGSCGVCNATVQSILRAERGKLARLKGPLLRFASRDSPLGLELQSRAQVPAGLDTVLWFPRVTSGAPTFLAHSDAVFAVLRYLGGPYALIGVLRALPRFLRDGAYRLFARHRSRIIPAACFVPAPDERARFLGELPE